MKMNAALKQAGGLLAALALAGFGVLAASSAAVAGGGLAISGEAAEATVDGAGEVALTVANEGAEDVRITGLTAPEGFTCAEAPALLPAGGSVSLACEGNYGERDTATFGVTGTAGETESSASTTVGLPRAEPPATAAPEAEGAVLTVDVTADKTTVHAGDPVTYTITVENVHQSVAVSDVVVRSPDVGECERDLGDMAPGRVEEYTCVSPAPDQDFRVRIRVRGYAVEEGGRPIAAHDNDVEIKVLSVGKPSPTVTPSASEGSPSVPATSAPVPGKGSGSGLAVTGSTAMVLATLGALLLAGGAGLWLLAQRRRTDVES